MSKKIISIVLVIAILMTFLAVPALAADDTGAMQFDGLTVGYGWEQYPWLIAGSVPSVGGSSSSSSFLAAYSANRLEPDGLYSPGAIGLNFNCSSSSGGFVPAGSDLNVSFQLGLGHGWNDTFTEKNNNIYTYDFTEPDSISKIDIDAFTLSGDIIDIYDSSNGVDGAFTYSPYYSDNAYGTETLIESNLFFNKSFYIEEDITALFVTISYVYDVSLVTSDDFYVVFDTVYARYTPHSTNGDIYNIVMSTDEIVSKLNDILQSQNLSNQVLSLFYDLVNLIFIYLTDLQTQYFDDICEKLNGIVTMLNNEGMQITQIIQVMDVIQGYLKNISSKINNIATDVGNIEMYIPDIVGYLSNIESYVQSIDSVLFNLDMSLYQIQQIVNNLYTNSNITQSQLDEIIELLGGLSIELQQTVIDVTEDGDGFSLLDLLKLIFDALISVVKFLLKGILNVFSHVTDLFNAYSFSDIKLPIIQMKGFGIMTVFHDFYSFMGDLWDIFPHALKCS